MGPPSTRAHRLAAGQHCHGGRHCAHLAEPSVRTIGPGRASGPLAAVRRPVNTGGAETAIETHASVPCDAGCRAVRIGPRGLRCSAARNVALAVRSPRSRRRRQFECTPEQVLTFLGLIRGHPLEVVFLFGMTLGLRIGEATGVLSHDLELDKHLLYLRHQAAPDVQADGGVCVCGKGVAEQPSYRISKRSLPPEGWSCPGPMAGLAAPGFVR